ncbi:hypothetical protein [Lysinibacillus sphaericus]|uniref:Lipoprotein n=1 Tax=Lysinibacillus sphaericus OT4b.31 TaxID=1285586 RepID=R7Z966_LYSSH|nr:hypothetical protein H131_20612 [Lysinibacillus sphaericus OT4b.31]
MKKLIFSAALVLSLGLAGCGADSSKEDKPKENGAKTEEPQKVLAKTTDDVIKHFKDDGLETGEVSDLPNDEFGNIRKEGKRVLIPSLGDDSGGRLFLFDSEENLQKAKSYYDELGNSGPMFYSHTHQSGLFLIQMNGDMEDNEFAKYSASLEKAVTGSTNVEIKEESKVNKADNLTVANVGDVVKDDFAGTYTITDLYEASTDKYKSADVEFTIDGIKTAKLKAENPDLIETAAETNVLILSMTGENLSDDTVDFHPNTAKMITDTKRQIDSNVMISPFESEFIGKVIQKGEVIFDLGEEGLEGVKELKFVFDSTSKDNRFIGDKITVVVPVNKK